MLPEMADGTFIENRPFSLLRGAISSAQIFQGISGMTVLAVEGCTCPRRCLLAFKIKGCDRQILLGITPHRDGRWFLVLRTRKISFTDGSVIGKHEYSSIITDT